MCIISITATDEQIDKAKEVIRKLTFCFQSESFENPGIKVHDPTQQLTFYSLVLQKHYRTLEALALEHEEVEEITDLTVPDSARIDKRAGKAIDEFKQLVFPNGFDPDARVSKRKVRLHAKVVHIYFVVF